MALSLELAGRAIFGLSAKWLSQKSGYHEKGAEVEKRWGLRGKNS